MTTDPEQAARAALDDFLIAWNAADIDAVRRTLNYPHITIGPAGQVIVAQTPDDFATDFVRMREREGWSRSSFDSFTLIDASPDKVHCGIEFSRYRADGTCYSRGLVLYIVTKQGEHWGMQLRSGMRDAR
jgi:hypothetical protein